MAIAGLSEENDAEAVDAVLKEMEALGKRMRELIAAQPPLDLLGYIYWQKLLNTFIRTDTEGDQDKNSDVSADANDLQFLLEYIHATLASTLPHDHHTLDELACSELIKTASVLREKAHLYAMISTSKSNGDLPDIYRMETEFHAKSAWITLRGNRYQVLEEEFYAFVLRPHDKMLREVYKIGSDQIALGLQQIANAMRSGHADAVDMIARQIDAATVFAEAQGISFEDAAPLWIKNNEGMREKAFLAFDDMMRGGICNVSRHTGLPPALLAELSYERGEETEFFNDGAYSGTPFRTLPARKKPLIKLDGDYYAIDPAFIRDAGYRALLRKLRQRKKEYEKDFLDLQKNMSESAFFTILAIQLKGAIIHREVYYKDIITNEWVESDTLILIDDVLILVEAKSGEAATIASPALNFTRHESAVQELLVKAYKQCKRFFDYLASAAEVPIYKLTNGKHVKFDVIKISNYRIMLPIGLTVESFAPFSANCKTLLNITPLLGKHSFVSLSIDDLFVLKRFLPTTGEFLHYMEVRQGLAGIRGAYLFDEIDHLGAYITKIRFDWELKDKFAKNKNLNLLVCNGMSEVVDRHFEGDDWETRPVPSQDYPSEVLGLLSALNRTRAPGWLISESFIRDYNTKARKDFNDILAECRATLDRHPYRYFSFAGDSSIFIWLKSPGVLNNQALMKAKASAAALAVRDREMLAIVATADTTEGYISAERFKFDLPPEKTSATNHLFEDAARMLSRQKRMPPARGAQPATGFKKIGRNEPCWCGSGAKFKKCHGP